MSPLHYILDGHTPRPAADGASWALWYEHADRQVALEVIGDIVVSTVFLGLDMAFGLAPEPILFETLIWRERPGGGRDYDAEPGVKWRTRTWDEAEAVHRQVVAYFDGPPEAVTTVEAALRILRGEAS